MIWNRTRQLCLLFIVGAVCVSHGMDRDSVGEFESKYSKGRMTRRPMIIYVLDRTCAASRLLESDLDTKLSFDEHWIVSIVDFSNVSAVEKQFPKIGQKGIYRLPITIIVNNENSSYDFHTGWSGAKESWPILMKKVANLGFEFK